MNTYLFFINVNFNSEISNRLHKDEKLKVKFEVDTSPALGFNIESKWIIEPEFASINVLDDASLFAGKIHAILCRTYKNNVKGRDYYDFMHFIRKGTKPNLVYLKNKLIQSGKIAIDDPFDIDDVKALLIKKIDIVNFDDIRKDAQRFLIENEDLSQYSKELFYDCIRRI